MFFFLFVGFLLLSLFVPGTSLLPLSFFRSFFSPPSPSLCLSLMQQQTVYHHTNTILFHDSLLKFLGFNFWNFLNWISPITKWCFISLFWNFWASISEVSWIELLHLSSISKSLEKLQGLDFFSFTVFFLGAGGNEFLNLFSSQTTLCWPVLLAQVWTLILI